MYTIERKAEIISLLEKNNKVDVNVLAEMFGASKETIRRDLRELAADGFVKRTHGGAVFTESSKGVQEYPLLVRGVQRFEEKNIICKRAAQYICDGDTIFIDNSSTTSNLLKYIDKSLRVTIVTNSIQLLIESASLKNNNLLMICLGGIFRSTNFSMYGSISQANAKSFYPDKAFVSCKGINPNTMLTDSSVYEVDTKRQMLSLSKEVYILADYTKFSEVGTVGLSDFASVKTIITDEKADVSKLKYLDRYDVTLDIAKK